MMYVFAVTIPANTPAIAPLVQEVKLAPGRIIAMAVEIPDRCVGLVHVQILTDLHVQWPSNPDASFSGDGVTITWPESYDLDPSVPKLRLVGWNLDDSFAHTITFRFTVTPQEQIDQENRALFALGFLADWYEQRGTT